MFTIHTVNNHFRGLSSWIFSFDAKKSHTVFWRSFNTLHSSYEVVYCDKLRHLGKVKEHHVEKDRKLSVIKMY